MQIKCTNRIPYFTVGEIYTVDNIDHEGYYWVVADDWGDTHFISPDNCVVVDDHHVCKSCNGRGYE